MITTRYCKYCGKYQNDIGFKKVIGSNSTNYKCAICYEQTKARNKQLGIVNGK